MTKQETHVCKGLAILFLYLHHLALNSEALAAYSVSFAPFTAQQAGGILYALKFCVSMFVFLSVYGMACQYRARAIETPLAAAQYAAARCIKLLTGFWAVYLAAQCFCFLGMDTPAAYGEPHTPRFFYMLVDLLGLANWWGSPSLNVTWWYLSLALLLIVLMPVFWWAGRRTGLLLVAISLFLMPALPGNLGAQLPAVAAGITMAQYGTLPHLRGRFRRRRVLGAVCGLAGLGVFGYLLVNKLTLGNEAFVECTLAVLACVLAFLYLAPVPGVRQALAFLGRHSMNLFLLHTFVYQYFLPQLVYRWGSFWLALPALVAVTLAMSCALEGAKKLLRFDKGVAWLIAHSNQALARIAPEAAAPPNKI